MRNHQEYRSSSSSFCPARSVRALLTSACHEGTARRDSDALQRPMAWLPPQAYHTSVVVEGQKCFFSPTGIVFDKMFSKTACSHRNLPQQTHVYNADIIGESLVLSRHFGPGSYDVTRKNCNILTKCACTSLVARSCRRVPGQGRGRHLRVR